VHHYQKQVKASLRAGLSSLPAPRNDYEIVVPDNEMEDTPDETHTNIIEDQADLDLKRDKDLEEKSNIYSIVFLWILM